MILAATQHNAEQASRIITDSPMASLPLVVIDPRTGEPVDGSEVVQTDEDLQHADGHRLGFGVMMMGLDVEGYFERMRN